MIIALNNEILTRTDSYAYDTGTYHRIYPGKIHSQDFHMWYHNYNYHKWNYAKDSNNSWWDFVTPLHNPPSEEKLADLNHYIAGNYLRQQLWAFIKKYNGL